MGKYESSIVIALLVVSWTTVASSAVVTQCLGPEGQRVFTQFGCPPQTTRQPGTETRGNLSIINTAALTKTEQQALQRLQRRLQQNRLQRERTRIKRNRTRAAQRTANQTRCAQARLAMDGLDDSRRKGYSAVEGRRYDAEEAHWRRQKRETC